MKAVRKFIILAIKKTDLGSAVAVRLTKITGKSKVPIHPKHFISQTPWFCKFVKKTDIIVDLGSGNGQNAIKLAKHCKKVIGLEFDEALIAIAKKSCVVKRIKNIEFKKAQLEKSLELKSSSVNKVIFLDVLEHLNNRDLILDEIKRVLKPGGYLYVGVPNTSTSWKKAQRSAGVCSYSDPDHKIEFTEGQIKKLLRKHNFKIADFKYGKYDIPFRGLLDIVGAIYLPLYKKADELRAFYVTKNPQEASGFEIIAQS